MNNELRKLREALKPLAELNLESYSGEPDEGVVARLGDKAITWKDVRHAARILEETKPSLVGRFPADKDLKIRVFNTKRADLPWEWEVLDSAGNLLLACKEFFKTDSEANDDARDAIETRRLFDNSITLEYNLQEKVIAAYLVGEDRVQILLRTEDPIEAESDAAYIVPVIDQVELDLLLINGLNRKDADWMMVGENEEFFTLEFPTLDALVAHNINNELLSRHMEILNAKSMYAMEESLMHDARARTTLKI